MRATVGEHIAAVIIGVLLAIAVMFWIKESHAQVQPVPTTFGCVRADMLGALVGTNDPKRTEIYTDDDGDRWFILENVSTGASAIGFHDARQNVFCAVVVKKPKGRGA